MQNFDILWEGQWDHHEPDNRTLYGLEWFSGINKDLTDIFLRLI